MPNMDEIGKILPSLLRKQIPRTEPYLLDILLPLWSRIVGKTIAQHSQPSHFASGVLTLATDSVTWSTQLRHLGDEIRLAINGFLGQSIVKKLRIKTVTQSSLFAQPKPPLGIAPSPPLSPEEVMETDSIVDPAIASALANSYTKYFSRPRR